MKSLCGARTVLYLHGCGWWSCKMYCQKEQASNSGLCRTFPKGSHYLITCIFILHLLFTAYLLNFDPLGLEGLWQHSLFAQRGNTPRVVILMGRWGIPWLLESSADAVLTIPPLNKTQLWESGRNWALLRRASLGSEDVGPETPGISSSNWALILCQTFRGNSWVGFFIFSTWTLFLLLLHLQNVWLLPQGEGRELLPDCKSHYILPR